MRIAKLQSHLASLPGIGAPVIFGANTNAETSHSRTLLPENSAVLESLEIVEDSAASLLCLDEISSQFPHLQVLALIGNVASGDLSMLAPLQGSLRRLVINACPQITGNQIEHIV